ncbi:TIGR02234 family membrane protein [Yinghuangia soli]|uniref:TIGR02234 family membrane protein n=1 Tax=Yinghuangia soli TaxID=2908204 RepID=A0AA41Q3P8_9ACTN|nr:TIGR02234 family membrane protein [Yinghuangia soli]MCF2530420.1 TIGR02234 family membrane protein [Yinghuangia soli]
MTGPANSPAAHPASTGTTENAATVRTGGNEAAADAAARKAVRREMGTALLLVLLGAALVLSLGGRVWAEGAALSHGTRFPIEASGSAVSKVPAVLALVGLAGAVAVLATRGVFRGIVGAVLALAGAGIAAAAVAGSSDRSALDAKAATKAAVEGVRAVEVTHTIWPWITLAGGVLMLLGGLAVMVRGRNWPGMGSRYEAPSTEGPARQAKKSRTSADLWNALDRGEDPTG